MKKKQNDAEKMKQDVANFKELEKKYNDAMKLLGEKELENSILRDLVKKSIPIGSSYLLDPARVSCLKGVPSMWSPTFKLLLSPKAS